MVLEEQDACDICEGDRSTKKNPIIFCDGEGCNMPIHKVCYKVDEIPEDDWYCQRCENKRKKKPTNILCCPVQTGAVRHTIIPGEFMHVVCAMWNKNIDSDIEPYAINKNKLDINECYICSKKKGLCIGCEVQDCTNRFHVTCGINNGLIIPAPIAPNNFTPKCGTHQSTTSKNSRKRRRLRPGRMKELSDSEETDDEDEDMDENEKSDDRSDESEEEQAEDDDLEGKEIPIKRSVSQIFGDSSDDDDDMGTFTKPRPKLNKNKSSSCVSLAIATNTTQPTSNTITNTSSNTSRSDSVLSYRERLEAKRKKSNGETKTPTPAVSLALDTQKPPSIPPPVVKQKLPNKAHLNNGNSTTSPVNNRPAVITPPIKKYNGNIIKDIDEIQNDIRAGAHRWGSISSGTAIQHPQPTTPHTVPTSFFDNDAKSIQGPRKQIDNWKVNGDKDELNRLRDEVRRLNEFKRSVSEVLSNLNVPIPGGMLPVLDNIENYVNQLHVILKRVGPLREQDRAQIQECVKGAMSDRNINQ
ncbi:hypothetical protein BDB01DRAFT_769695 [Pilobolus umbonatus]|nr:hypothetical protein BDB01DRAFT_769695 [Pilobolus umbonatus]